MRKLCRTCGVKKIVEEFSLCQKSRDGRQNTCKRCDSERLKSWRVANPDQVAAQVPRRRASQASRAYVKRLRTKQVQELHHDYLANQLMYLKGVRVMDRKDLTPELLELKRGQLTLHRLSKQIKTQLKGKDEAL